MVVVTSTATGTDTNDNDDVPEEYREIANRELRETDNIRKQSLAQMTEWIQKHPNIKKCRTDAPFLLRFLRTKKFSVPLACEMLERFLTIRQMYPEWFQKLDCDDADLHEILSAGYLVPLLQRYQGKVVLFCCAKRFDPYKFNSAHMARVHSLVTETLADDEINQIAGYCYVNDENGLSMGHLSLWSMTDIRNIMKCIQHSSPMRHKETHFLNLPPFAIKIIQFALSFLSDKLRDRIKMHANIDSLHRDIDKSILPLEYGGEIPLSHMIEKFQKKLCEKRDTVLALDDMFIELNENESKLLREMKSELGLGLDGSFKKLEID